MNLKNKYWKIECTKHLSTIYEAKVSTKNLSEEKLKNFIITLMSKYALSDNEILEQHLRVPFKKTKCYINILRTNSGLGEPLMISFMTQVADISICATLTD